MAVAKLTNISFYIERTQLRYQLNRLGLWLEMTSCLFYANRPLRYRLFY